MAVSRRYFPGVSQAQLETWLSAVLEEIATGKVTDGAGAGDTNYHKYVDPSLPAERRRDLILNDLSILDPAKYPPRDLARIKRTVPQYL